VYSEIIFGKIFFCSFSLCFQLFSVKRPDGLFCMSGRGGSINQTFLLQVRTHAAVPVTYVVRCIQMVFVIIPNGEPYRIISHSPCAARHSSLSLDFGRLYVIFLIFSRAFLTCPFFVISLLPRYVSLPFFLLLRSFYIMEL
jgi:hypothetical protein